ncbi:Rab family GTPase [Flavobacterium sp. SUN052]|uniref:Rab family GTPase n=1 Tax=Flavobacterium sp. SUN052 TaxID=3002441 RepID=UPI00237E023F|nr:Rab family GTPase [Flavobacterium sp. SUN052]MEC4004143.1 Rab family GTPase [Flavobacterium sp. SUN052]
MISSKKIVLVGHFGVGKSSIMRRFVQDTFSDNYTVTIGVHILKKEIVIQGLNLTLIIWDIEGKDDIQKVRNSYLLGTSGFIYVIDPTRVQTFERFNQEIDFLKINYPTAKIVSVANKMDVVDQLEFKKILSQKMISIDYFASAKTGNEIENLFQYLAMKITQDV